MKVIVLTKGQVTKVDDLAFEFISRWKWQARKNRRGLWYAERGTERNGKKIRISMARVILGAPKGVEVDHWNGDTLDNQRVNLRLATTAQNQHNQRRLRKDNTSGFKGVTFFKPKRKWNAQIYLNRKRINLGYFLTKEQAATAYDEAAKLYFGEFACTNAEMTR